MKKVAGKIWAKHASVLDYILGQRTTRIEPFIKSVNSDVFLKKLNEKLDKRTAELFPNKNSRYTCFFIKEWKNLNKLKYDITNPPLIIMEIDILESSIYFRFQMGPHEDSLFREKIFNVLQSKNVVKRSRDLSPEHSTLESKTFKSGNNMVEFLENFEQETKKNQDKILSDFQDFAIDFFVPLLLNADEALTKSM